VLQKKNQQSPAAPARRAEISASADLDQRIIACLRADGRLPTRDIAAAVGASEAVVRARIRRLEQGGHMRIVAMVDLTAMGFDFLSVVGISVRGRAAADVARDLSRIPQVMTAIVMLGGCDIEIRVIARSLPEISELVTQVLPAVPGVERVTPALAVNIVKYENEWVPFQ
jgi:Lrp/AsnC family transcriptional regulator for asnA, asnC and gidA